DGSCFLATVSNGDGGEYAHYLRKVDAPWLQVTKFSDLIPTIEFGVDNSLYLMSNKGTPRGQILHLLAGQTELSEAKVVVAESEVTIKTFLPTDSKLYVVDLAGGPRQLRILDLESGEITHLPVQPMSYVGNLTCTGRDHVLLRSRSYLEPSAWYRYEPGSNQLSRTSMYKTSPAEFEDTEVVREWATSKDGTKIPMSIIRRKDIKLEGQNPTILYGYGGYGISLSPSFDATRRLWLDQGGVYVVANLRGGGEFGEEWHLAGNLTKKQNVFDDFNACAEHLIEAGYTSPERLAIEGGSNGGLLMGAAVTQRPELYSAAVSRAGIYDMLRVELDPNGVFNITEFGTVENPDHFAALLAYSPFHNVSEGSAYPAVLFTTGQHDGRVNPMQSRKMTAALQRATVSDRPILLRTSSTTGHGRGTALSTKIAIKTDVYTFILDQLKVRYRYDH
ncbi:MAG: S9 family peptidase, partial [bacterium]|nr:S9 family peptidase [bacterium]